MSKRGETRVRSSTRAQSRRGDCIPARPCRRWGWGRSAPTSVSRARSPRRSRGGRRRLPALRLRVGVRQRGCRRRGARKQVIRGGIKREAIWVTSKLWNDKHGEEDVIASCRKSLADLRLDYLDLYLVHWPFPNFHPPGCDVTSRSPNAKPYIHELHEDMAQDGRAGGPEARSPYRHVQHDRAEAEAGSARRAHQTGGERDGASSAFPAARIVSVRRRERRPARSAIVRSARRDARSATERPTTRRRWKIRSSSRSPSVTAIHPAAVCIKWAVKRGQTPIPFSVNPRNYAANLRAAAEDPLSDEEMQAIAGIDRNCRLIKGQVFLWKEGQSWEDLWDVNGEITPP